MIRVALVAVWLALGAVPLAWWWRGRRRVDVWPALPVPAALLDTSGAVLRTTGPANDVRFAIDAVPAPGRIVRGRGGDGVPLAMTGLPGGALALALPADPVAERRTACWPSSGPGWRTTSTPRWPRSSGIST